MQKSDENGRGELVAGECPRQVLRGHLIQDTRDGAKIDWLAFTISGGADGVALTAADWASELSGFAELPALDRGQSGYDQGFRLPGNGLVMFNIHRPDMGVHVSLSSGALGLLPFTPKEMIGKVLAAGGRFSRADVALDSSAVSYETVEGAVRKGDIVTRASEINFGQTVKRSDRVWVPSGAIMRIGSRTSRRYIRIYDKGAQQKVEGVWTRIEVEFKSEAAQMAAAHIMDDQPLEALIFSSLDFRDSAVDENLSRCPRLDWWRSWIGYCDRLSFAIQKIEKTVKDKAAWLLRQAAPSIALVHEAGGRNMQWIKDLIASGNQRLNPAHKLMIDAMARPQRTISEIAPDRERGPRPKRIFERVGLGEPPKLEQVIDAIAPSRIVDMFDQGALFAAAVA